MYTTGADFSPLDHIRDRILGVGHGRRAAGGKRRREDACLGFHVPYCDKLLQLQPQFNGSI